MHKQIKQNPQTNQMKPKQTHKKNQIKPIQKPEVERNKLEIAERVRAGVVVSCG